MPTSRRSPSSSSPSSSSQSSSSASSPAAASSGPSLTTKVQPAQQRAAETFERILDAAARTLTEVGIERLSTNLVCERAGLSPPALYRYFPNKYSLLAELGKRLMQRQNDCIEHWISEDVLAGGRAAIETALVGLLLETYQATRDTEGGVWIMRALRAVPALQEIRLTSHAQVTRAQARLLGQALPGAKPAELKLASRIVVELIYATVEMLFDESLDAKRVAAVTAGMLASHVERLVPTAPTASAKSSAISTSSTSSTSSKSSATSAPKQPRQRR